MINTIILDIGNVLASFDYISYMKEKGYEPELIERIRKATVENPLWKEIDRSDSETIEESLINRFIDEDPEIAKEIRTFLKNSYEIVKEYDYAPDFIRSIKKGGYPVYLLSNYSRANFRHITDKFEFFKYVDGGVISYEVASVKPEAKIYEALINKYRMIPEEAVFLDDLKVNIEAASRMGFNTIHFKNIDQAVKELRILGVNI